MSERLRVALDSESVPRDLEARVRARLDQRSPSPVGRLISSFALLALVLGGTQYYAVKKTRDLFRTGIADHVQCAIAGTYPRQADRASMLRDLGPWSLVLQPVLDKAPGDSVVSAHRCTVNGREYVHMILRRDKTLISVVMTRRSDSESFPRALTANVVRASGIPIHEGSLDGYSVASFQSGAYLGYVISGLPGADNGELAVLIAPVVARYTGT